MMMIDKHILIEELQKATANAIKPDFAKGLLEAQRIALNQRVVLDKPPINPKKVESDEEKRVIEAVKIIGNYCKSNEDCEDCILGTIFGDCLYESNPPQNVMKFIRD